MVLIRLDKSDPTSWALYPIFERRVLAFAQKYTRIPTELLRETTQRRWVVTPLACGYWVWMNDNSVVAHFLSYIAGDEFGRPFVEFYQLECDSGHSLLPMLAELGSHVQEWVRTVNQSYEAQNITSRVEYGALSTWHQHGAYRRLLNMSGLTFEEERRVLHCAFGDGRDRLVPKPESH